jgi:transcriptional regulator with XRE-family HTH domain
MAKKPDILVKLGQKVRQLRKNAGITSQEALADICGLDRTYIGGIERGERNVSMLNLAKIAKALGVSLPVLTDGL